MSTISKLLIVRVAKMTQGVLDDLLAKFGDKLVSREPIIILPAAWSDEQDPSHDGYILAGLRLKDIQALRQWESEHSFATLIDLGNVKGKVTPEEALASVGLRLHPLVEQPA